MLVSGEGALTFDEENQERNKFGMAKNIKLYVQCTQYSLDREFTNPTI